MYQSFFIKGNVNGVNMAFLYKLKKYRKRLVKNKEKVEF